MVEYSTAMVVSPSGNCESSSSPMRDATLPSLSLSTTSAWNMPGASHTARRSAMCHSGPMRLETVELIRVRVPLRQPFRTAHGVTTHKESVLVCCTTDEGVGWGECAAETAPSYTAEFVDGAWLVLRDHLLPRLLSGPWSSYEELDERLAAVRGHPMAKAAIETALLDAHLRERKKSLASYLGATRSTVPVGVVVDLAG